MSKRQIALTETCAQMSKGQKQMNNMYKNSKLHKCKVQEVNVNG